MDVKKILLIIPLILLIACEDDNNGNNSGLSRPDKPIVDCEPQEIAGEYLVRWKDGTITIESDPSEKHFINTFLKDNAKFIDHAEPHYRLKGYTMEDVVAPFGFGGDLNWGIEKISAPEVWDQNYKGQGIIVAVIDSGFDATHEELQGVLAVNEAEELNDQDDDGNGLIDDRFGYDFVGRSGEMLDRTGHGSHVSGIIVARHDTGAVLGAAPEAKLLPLNFIDETGTGSINSAINSIRYAAHRGAKVINASWGGEFCSLALKKEIKDLEEDNILFVSASGNSNKNIEIRPEYPAAFELDNHISVGASTFRDRTANFSNYGDPVAVVAPGANIISTVPKQYDFPTCDNSTPPVCAADGLAALDGTSMAAPFVSAAAAILWSAKPEATFLEIKDALIGGVNAGPYPVSSRGRINVQRSLEILLNSSVQP